MTDVFYIMINSWLRNSAVMFSEQFEFSVAQQLLWPDVEIIHFQTMEKMGAWVLLERICWISYHIRAYGKLWERWHFDLWTVVWSGMCSLCYEVLIEWNCPSAWIPAIEWNRGSGKVLVNGLDGGIVFRLVFHLYICLPKLHLKHFFR
jgi:hypothetical protein